MVSLYESIMAASVIVGLLSVPAASETLQPQESLTAELDEVSTEHIPENVVEEVSSDRFFRTAESAFQEFTTEVESDSTEIVLENPSSRLEVEQKPGEKIWRLVTSDAEMEQIQTPEKTEEVFKMPEGTLQRTEKNGEIREEFEGSDRQHVEQKASDLREKMELKMEEVEDRQEDAMEQAMPDFSLEVNPEEEYVQIQNLENREIDLEGWELHDNTSNVYEFDTEIEAGEEITLYSHEGHDSEDELYWGYSEGYSVWSQNGDVATLYNGEGEKIARQSY